MAIPEEQWGGDVVVPTAAQHQEFRAHGADAFEGVPAILHQDDVAIDVAEGVVAGDGLGAGKEIVEALGAPLVALGVGLVAESELPSGFGGAFVVTEENDFDLGMQGLPGLQGVTLDDAGVAAEGLGGGGYC